MKHPVPIIALAGLCSLLTALLCGCGPAAPPDPSTLPRSSDAARQQFNGDASKMPESARQQMEAARKMAADKAGSH